MVMFCETRFAQSKLKVYISFEHDYITYCGTRGTPKVVEDITDQSQQQEPKQNQEEEEDDD